MPGTAVWRPSICPLCPAGCGLIARVMDSEVEVLRNGQLGLTRMGLAKKLEGNPDHPINRGKLCTRGQAAAEITYHPDRVGHPLKRAGARGEGKFEEIPWDQALGELVSTGTAQGSHGIRAHSGFRAIRSARHHRIGLTKRSRRRLRNRRPKFHGCNGFDPLLAKVSPGGGEGSQASSLTRPTGFQPVGYRRAGWKPARRVSQDD